MYQSVNTSLRELLPLGFLPSTKRTQNPVPHALIIAKQVSSLAAQTGPHATEASSLRSGLCADPKPNAFWFIRGQS